MQAVQLSCQPSAGRQAAALEACWETESVPGCLQDADHGGSAQQAPTAVAAATATPGLLAGGCLCDGSPPCIPSRGPFLTCVWPAKVAHLDRVKTAGLCGILCCAWQALA